MVLPIKVSAENAVEAFILNEADGVEVAAVAVHLSGRHVGEVEVSGQLEGQTLAGVSRVGGCEVAEVDEVLLVAYLEVAARGVPRQLII